MKKFFLLLIGVIFLATACQKDNLVNENDPSVISYEKAGKPVTKTIKFFEVSGTFEFDYTSGECAEGVPYATLEGEGNASHIGHYTVANYGCYDGESVINGLITAANGDEIHTYVDDAWQDPDTEIWYYHYVIYGGTGRFDEAFGDVDLFGTIDFENFEWTMEGEGTITY